jgi:hypothetical protein
MNAIERKFGLARCRFTLEDRPGRPETAEHDYRELGRFASLEKAVGWRGPVGAMRHLTECLTGKSASWLSSPLCKNIPVSPSPKSLLYPSPSRPTEGRFAIGTGCGGRDSVGRAMGSQGGFWLVSDRQHADERCCFRFAKARRTGTKPGEAFGEDGSRTVKSCGPDASTPASSLAEAMSARPGADEPYSQTTETRKPDLRGEREISR